MLPPRESGGRAALLRRSLAPSGTGAEGPAVSRPRQPAAYPPQRDGGCSDGPVGGAGGRPAGLPPDRAASGAGRGRTLPEHVTGAVLFADVSGFTALTERLVTVHGPRRGVEELTSTLERVFTAVLEVLLGAGGEVVSFSGDAVTCFLDGDDGTAAAACGLRMQDALRPVAVPVGAGDP